jgi:hypothetical protein
MSQIVEELSLIFFVDSFLMSVSPRLRYRAAFYMLSRFSKDCQVPFLLISDGIVKLPSCDHYLGFQSPLAIAVPCVISKSIAEDATLVS